MRQAVPSAASRGQPTPDWHALTEGAPDAILCADRDGRVTYLNRAAQRLWAHLRPGSISVLDLFVPSGATKALAAALHAAGQPPSSGLGRDEAPIELVAQAAGGHLVAVEASVASGRGDGDAPFIFVVRDITARKEAERATRAAANQGVELENLRRMNAMKTQLLNTAAHELNTPLTPLRLQLHMLRSGTFGELQERQARAVGILDRNVERLSVLIQEILDVARLEGGRLKLQRTPCEVDGMLGEAVDSFEEAASQLGLQLSADPAPGLVVAADRNRVLQILYNLISNALKFTPAGGRITLGAEPAGDAVAFFVQDTGLGLSADQMGRLFQPFTQVHDPQQVTVGGTGLGLFICRGIVEAHGGRIGVESLGPGKGSRFHFTLPVTAADGAVRPAPLPAPGDVEPPQARVVLNEPLARRLRELI